MKIYLYFSEEVERSLCESIYNRIKTQPGPIEYIWLEEPTGEIQIDELVEAPKVLDVFTWEELFTRCENYRDEKNKRITDEKMKRIKDGKMKRIKDENRIKDEDVVVLFTDYKNARNFFSAWDLTGRLNFFVQTSDWEIIIESDPSYPIIYELASIPLAIAAFNGELEMEAWAHKKPRGCVFDYCKEKDQAQLRLRTADICPDCRKLLIDKEIDSALARQIFETFDSIRTQMMFRTRFEITETPSYVEIDTRKRTLSFLNMGHLSFKLSPQEIAMYIFFLNHPEGVSYSGMVGYNGEMLKIYGSVAKNVKDKKDKKDKKDEKDGKDEITAILAQIKDTVTNMVDENLHDRKHDIVSNIRGKFEQHIGEELAKQYVIQEMGQHRYGIPIDREYIVLKQD